MGASLGNGKFVSEINVTPFVDVMLVLLIIFMVATPMMSQGLDVDLPQTKQVEVLPTEADHMILTVRKDGKIFLDEYAVNSGGLSSAPGQGKEQKPLFAGRQRSSLRHCGGCHGAYQGCGH